MPRGTLAGSMTCTGPGLHTGVVTTVTCLPAASGAGIVFRRMDLPGSPVVRARLDQVTATERRTALGAEPVTIHTVEHLLAAVAALELDDLEIEVDGPELPILDGSFEPWREGLAGAGRVDAPGTPSRYTVTRPFTVRDGDSEYAVEPEPGTLELRTTIEWDHPLIGLQVGHWTMSAETFARELAAARTFGFVHEVEELRRRGLLQGGTLESAVVLNAQGVVSGALRWPDEFVRHKTGDILGDLALLGGRVDARITALRPSHRGNIALARAIERTARRSGTMSMDINRILEVIPHRYPFLLVDRIVEVIDNRKIVGLKNVTINEPFFQGHFPGHPIMPGVLIVESMAQVGGFLLLEAVEDVHDKVVYFMSMDGVKFRRPVLPGDQLRLEVEMLQFRGKTCKMRGEAFVEGQLVCEAEMMARVVDR
ncbi:MAG TPA: UDP-3-O-acyl-N-acetylglucosamine deacetylase [Gemmatimonadales bacterium]|nr:UDP-3-O-acyl-N-acetylglucosamine deacetylase [Gemmatimonadales bacterium]